MSSYAAGRHTWSMWPFHLFGAGPLEATIHSMQSELTTKATESSEMQRRWLAMQTELVTLQVSRPFGKIPNVAACARAKLP